jgi:hypothetical protein
MQDLRNREDALRDKMQQLGDQDQETANRLEQDLDKTRAEIAETERRMRDIEFQQQREQGLRPIQRESNPMGTRRPQGPVEMTTVVYKLQYANPNQLQVITGSLLTQWGKASADERTNSLIVMDTLENQKRIQDVITKLDVQGTGPRAPSGEVDELRSQVNGLQQQMQKIQAMLEQIASQKGKQGAQPQEMKKF